MVLMATPATKATNMSINLSAILYREGGVWLAHCLELDIVAEGSDASDAFDSLKSLRDLQITVALKEGDIESVFRPAPPEIWKLFAAGTERATEVNVGRGKSRGFKAPVNRFESRQVCFV